MKAGTFITFLLLLSFLQAIQIRNRKIYDDQGRQIRFRGPNVVVKVPPYMPITDHYNADRSFSEEDMKECKSRGFNGIRLGMMWAGVEPTPQGYNETYLDQMEKLINRAGEYGIYTLIDFHQDLIAQQFCGDGVPTWLMKELGFYKTFPFPVNKTIKLNESGLPSWKDCNTQKWGEYYFSYDVGETFNNLYHPGHKLNKKFTDFWVKVATKFRGNKNVIAYELINQPFPGNVIRNPIILIPSMAQRINFQSFYDRLSTQIRKVDPKTPICFEPITFDNEVPTGFSHPPGGNIHQNNSIYCYHYYQPPGLSPQTIDYRVRDGNSIGVASFMTEFSQGRNIQDVLNKTYTYKQSWLFWGYKSFGKNWGSTGLFKENSQDMVTGISEHLSPTYMQRTAGELKEENFNYKTHDYFVIYNAKPKGKSLLYLHEKLNYPKGYEVQLNPKELITWNQLGDGYFEVEFNGDEEKPILVFIRKL